MGFLFDKICTGSNIGNGKGEKMDPNPRVYEHPVSHRSFRGFRLEEGDILMESDYFASDKGTWERAGPSMALTKLPKTETLFIRFPCPSYLQGEGI